MPTPTEQAIEMLKANPESADQFEQVFGAGSAQQYLSPDQGSTGVQTVDVEAEPVAIDVAPGAPLATEEVETDEAGVLDHIVDGAAGILGGAMDSIEASGDLVAEGADAIGLPAAINLGGFEGSENYGVFMSLDEVRESQARDPVFGQTALGENDHVGPHPETLTGEITNGISQFVTTFVGVGKFTRGFQATTRAGQLARAAGQGAVADFIGFHGNEGRLSDLLAEHPALGEIVPEFMTTQEGDTELEGRFKNALEGVVIGGAVDSVFQMFRVIRQARQAGTPEAAEEIIRDNIEIMEAAREALDPNAARETTETLAEDGTTRATVEAPQNTAQATVDDVVDDTIPTPGVRQAQDQLDAARMQAARRPLFDQSTGGLNETLMDQVRTRGYTQIDPTVVAEHFNTRRMTTDADVSNLIGHIAEAWSPVVDDMITSGRYDNVAMMDRAKTDMAELLGPEGDVEAVIQRLGQAGQSAEQQISYLLGGKSLINSLANEIDELARRMDEVPGSITPEDDMELARLIGQLGDVEASVQAIRTSSARVTQAGRVEVGAMDTEELLRRIKEGGDPREVVLEMRAFKGNPAAMAAFARRVRAGDWRDMVSEYWVNSILSGPKTHLVNISSGIINSVLLPLEKTIGGAVSLNGQATEEGARQLVYTLGGWVETLWGMSTLNRMGHKSDSAAAIGRSFLEGQNILDPNLSKFDAPTHAITSERAGPGGAFVRGVGTAVRMPTRFLSSEDEFFKQVNYRATLRARLVTEGRRNGLSGDRLTAFVNDRFAKGFDENGRGIDDAALTEARRSTFTQPLRPGHLSSRIQGVARTPMLRPLGTFIAPFIRTPSNIISAVATRTPGLRRLTGEFAQDMARDPITGRYFNPTAAASAHGRLVTGAGLFGLGATLSLNGQLTGSGPSDREQRQILMATGWRPHSYVITNDDGTKEYIPLARLEPFSMFLGMAADLTDLAQHVEEREYTAVASGAIAAFANNLASKTYLTGISEFLRSATDPGPAGARWIRNIAAGFVPSGLRQTSEMLGLSNDPYLREVQNDISAFKARIPGLSETLPPRRNWITGEPIAYDEGYGFLPDSISPFTISRQNGELPENHRFVLEELANLEHGWGPPSRNLRGVELTPQEYDELVRTIGTNSIGRRTMVDALATRMRRDNYDIDRANIPDHPDSHRHRMIDDIIVRYRDAGTQVFLRNNPEIRDRIQEHRRARRQSQSASPSTANQGLNALEALR